jgi:hypothetical protein
VLDAGLADMHSCPWEHRGGRSELVEQFGDVLAQSESYRGGLGVTVAVSEEVHGPHVAA